MIDDAKIHEWTWGLKPDKRCMVGEVMHAKAQLLGGQEQTRMIMYWDFRQ